MINDSGVSPSGKATDSDSVIRRFKSCYPSFDERGAMKQFIVLFCIKGEIFVKQFLYKKAELSDVPILVEISMKKLLEDFHWDADMQKMFRERYKESIPRLMKERILVFYLAYQKEMSVGMAVIYIWSKEIAEGEATLSSIYILPKFRGNGIFQHLFDMSVKEAKERNCTVIKTGENGNRKRLHQLGFQDLYDYDEEGVYCLSSEMELLLI